MQLKKIILSLFFLSMSVQNFAMDNEGSQIDDSSSSSAGLRRVATVTRGAFIPVAGGRSTRTTLCRYPAMCFSFNELKRLAGLPAKPNSDSEIADAMNRISSPVREVFTRHASNSKLYSDANGENIFDRGGSIPKESPAYQGFMSVVKNDEFDQIIMNPRPTSPEVRELDAALARVIAHDYSHVPQFEAGV